MTLPKEILQAYIDGALPPGEMRRVEDELTVNPEAQSYVAQQRALLHSLRSAFDPILEAPVPAALSDMLARPRPAFAWRHWGLWTALPSAVALACGVLITLSFRSGDIVSTNGALMARGALAKALTQQLASDETGRDATIGVSFRDKNGHYCRTFVTTQALAGVACHEDSAWKIAAVEHVGGTETNGVYRPAGSAMPDFVRSAVTAMLAGEPLDAAAERKQRDAGWR